MNWWQVIVISIVEALSEFLPISSTAHMILVGRLIEVGENDFVSSFTIIIQLGAILAVLIVFGKRIWESKKMWPKIGWALGPTLILGAVAFPLVKDYLLAGVKITGWALILGGILMIIWEKWLFQKNEKVAEVEKISNGKAASIGAWQALAFVPGVSRSAAAIWGGMMAGLNKAAAVEFAFILAIPTMAAATGLDILKTFYDQFLASGGAGTGGENIFSSWNNIGFLCLGLVITFLVAWLTIKQMLKLMQAKNSFIYLGIYRIIIGIVWLCLF